jgi:hypothetical protein
MEEISFFLCVNRMRRVSYLFLLIDREWGENETGVSMKLGYGLNYYFSEHWSMMPGIDIRRDTEHRSPNGL